MLTAAARGIGQEETGLVEGRSQVTSYEKQVHVCNMNVCMGACVYGSRRLTLGVFLDGSPLYLFIEAGSLTEHRVL